MLTVSSAKLTGTPGPTGWAQVHEFKPEDPLKFKARGHLFAVVATQKGKEGVENILTGRELLTRLHEEYFGVLEESAFSALKSAVGKVVEEFRLSWGEVEIAAAVVMDGVVFSVAAGGAEVAILRNGMFAKILTSGSGPSADGGVISASGYPKEKDVLLIGTKVFFASFTTGVIKAAMELKDPDEAVESLAPIIHAGKDLGNLGAVIIKFAAEDLFAAPALLPVKPPSFASVKRFNTLLRGLRQSPFSKLMSKLPKRQIYVKGAPEQVEVSADRKKAVSVGILLLTLLAISIGFGLRQKHVNERKSRYEERLNQAQHQFDEATSLVTLNPQRARELLNTSRDMAATLTEEGVEDARLNALRAEIEKVQSQITGEYKVDPALFLDLSLISSDFTGKAMFLSGSKLFILDEKGKKIVKVAVGTKKTEVVAGPDQVEGALGLAAYEDSLYILTSDGIFSVGDKKTSVVSKDWDDDVIFSVYAGNVYLLEKSQGTIWRYPGIPDNGFSSKQNWLGPGVKPNFSNVKMLAIDGSIWLLSGEANLLKFSQGSPQSFAMSDVILDIISITAIATNEEAKDLYLLDKQAKRIVVLAKSGEYKAQYLADKINEATSFVVAEKEKKLILLLGSKLYEIPLQHL